jgi:hypothetical protein
MGIGEAPAPRGAAARAAAGRVVESDAVRPSLLAGLVALGMTVVSLLLAGLIDPKGDGFVPRVETLDQLAGLAVGAFIVDRLLTFVPPLIAAENPKQRATDLKVLRLGWGAAVGAGFVLLTDLRAVKELTPDFSTTIGAGLDRGITVLAIAGGVAGLARLLAGINPPPATDATMSPDRAVAEDADTIPAPAAKARVAGALLVGVGALIALFALGDTDGIDLSGVEVLTDGSEPQMDGDDENQGEGTIAIVVRFAPLLLAAAIVEQLVEVVGRVFGFAKNNKPLYLGGLSVALGVVAAKAFDLYLLHNVGFFGAEPKVTLDSALAASSNLERWGDLFLTGVTIGAGTKALHDLSSRLRKAKRPAAGG